MSEEDRVIQNKPFLMADKDESGTITYMPMRMTVTPPGISAAVPLVVWPENTRAAGRGRRYASYEEAMKVIERYLSMPSIAWNPYEGRWE